MADTNKKAERAANSAERKLEEEDVRQEMAAEREIRRNERRIENEVMREEELEKSKFLVLLAENKHWIPLVIGILFIIVSVILLAVMRSPAYIITILIGIVLIVWAYIMKQAEKEPPLDDEADQNGKK